MQAFITLHPACPICVHNKGGHGPANGTVRNAENIQKKMEQLSFFFLWRGGMLSAGVLAGHSAWPAPWYVHRIVGSSSKQCTSTNGVADSGFRTTDNELRWQCRTREWYNIKHLGAKFQAVSDPLGSG